MSQAASTPTPPADRPPPLKLDRFDLDNHADGMLMRLCGCLGRMRGQLEALERAIEAIPAATIEGRRMKAMSL